MTSSSAPLLTHLEAEDTSSPLSFDTIVEESLSAFGLRQILQIVFIGLAFTFDSMQIFITVFTDAYPKWHCLDHTICNPTTTTMCGLPRSAWDWDNGFKGKSVISEFDLECSSSFLRGLPTSAFYMGSIFGGILLSMIPDGFLGRKQLLFLSTSTMSLTGISIFFSSNIWSYVFLKFLVGFARSQTSAVHSIFLCFFALESPRWLHLQGRNLEAIEVLKRISPETRAYLESVSSRLHQQQQTLEQAPRYTIKDLFIRNWAFRRIVLVMIIMFGLGMSYYGVPLAVRDIKLNIYLSEALTAMVELPSFVITPILLERFTRRSSVLVNSLLGGASGVLCFVLSLLGRTKIAFGLELVSFLCARIGFNLMAVYIVELFPTCVRNCAMTMLRQALVVGGACCPLIASIGRHVPSLSFAVFGFAMSGFGLFVLLLPETKGSSLCDTMEAQEQSDQALKISP
ncbi:hypothetical protein Bca101_046479 [Brassica carinata]